MFEPNFNNGYAKRNQFVWSLLQKQADVNFFLLLLGFLCHLLPLLVGYLKNGEASAAVLSDMQLSISRGFSIVMLISYIAYLVFQLWTHRQLFDAQEQVTEIYTHKITEECYIVAIYIIVF